MRTTQYFLGTLREVPSDAEIISHQLMLRAGMIRKLAAGLYTWLPLGLRVLKKVETVVREEMNRIGGMEILMPAVQPAELWDLYKKQTDREEHVRIHPMLHWREIDIWRYIEHERIPTVSLYFSRGGKRYRSIGCETCCAPINSRANTIRKIIKELETTTEAERSGRSQDKENTYTMQKLRSLGYM